VLVALWAFPAVRYTLQAQFQFALMGDNLAWMRALDSRRSEREIPRLDAAAARFSGDYLMQIGRATALADVSIRAQPHSARAAPSPQDDRTLVRLGIVARNFPYAPGAYAHFTRYMMAERVRIERVELRGSQATPEHQRLARSIPARLRDVELMEWALRSGEKRDPDNGYWPAMLAVTYFAALRDEEALQALSRSARTSRWDSYLYEEVLGQWRLYSAAYGDNGAAQKIAPLSLIAFPHLRELRHTAEMARWYADRAAAAGRPNEAIRIRRNLVWLGALIREKTLWVYEALYGTDLTMIATTDSGISSASGRIRNRAQWERQAKNYLVFLQAQQFKNEASWLRKEVEAACEIREKVDIARFDASYPGIPPGIPLMPLFGNWMMGISLLQQMLMLSLTTGAVLVLRHRPRWFPALPSLAQWLVSGLLVGAMCVAAVRLWFGIPTAHSALAFVLSGTGTLLLVMQRLATRRGTPSEAAPPIETLWHSETTIRILLVLLVPGLIALILLRPALSTLHPVAAMLAHLMAGERPASVETALGTALLVCGLPVGALLLSSLWGLLRRVAPAQSVPHGLLRLTLPALLCLSVAYLALLERTLRLDAAASRAINEAARHDLHWVLTHSSSIEE
jgi:hypothetical protein